MAETLETLEVEVVHRSQGASDEIIDLARAIDNLGGVLKNVMPQLKEFAATLKSVKGKTVINITNGSGNSASPSVAQSGSKSPSDWSKSVTEQIEGKDTSGVDSIKDALDPEAFSALQHIGETISNVFGKAASIFKSLHLPLAKVKEQMEGVARAEKKVAKNAPSVAKGIKDVGKAASKSQTPLSNFLSSLKRIAFYRLIRSIIKSITEAFSEGLQNAYAFSQGIESEGHRFSAAMDSLSSSGLKMKNQLGSAFISLLTAITPIVNAIIAVVTKLADALSQLFAVFTGGTYLKAKDVSVQFADTMGDGAKSAKEWKNQLLGFDVINRLEAPSDSGGGSGAAVPNPADMFEDTPIDGIFKKIKDKLDELKEKIDFEPLRQAVERLKESFGALADTIGKGIGWVWENILAPFVEWFIEKLAPVVVDFIGAVLDLTNAILQFLAPAFEWLWEEALKPLADFIGETLIWVFQNLTEVIKEFSRVISGEVDFQTFWSNLDTTQKVLFILMGVLAAVGVVVFALNHPFLILGALVVVVAGWIIKHWEDIKQAFQDGVEYIKEKISWLREHFTIDFSAIGETFRNAKEKVLDFFHLGDATEEATTDIGNTKNAFEDLDVGGSGAMAELDTAITESSNNISTALSGISESASNAFNSLLGGMGMDIGSAFESDTGMMSADAASMQQSSGGLEAVVQKFQEMSDQASVTAESYDGLAESVSGSVSTIDESFSSMNESWSINVEQMTQITSELGDAFDGLQNTVDAVTVSNLSRFEQMTVGFNDAKENVIAGIGSIKSNTVNLRDVWAQCFRHMTLEMLYFAEYVVDLTYYVVSALSLIAQAAMRAAMAMMLLNMTMGMFGGGVSTSSVPQFASGGFPEDGLFMANHGELVGQFSNGKTAVANNQEITEGIAIATYNAFMKAMEDSGTNNKNNKEVVLNINGREFARATYDDQREVARERGNSLVANA